MSAQEPNERLLRYGVMWRNLPPKCVSSIINSHNLKLQNTARHRARRSKAPSQF